MIDKITRQRINRTYNYKLTRMKTEYLRHKLICAQVTILHQIITISHKISLRFRTIFITILPMAGTSRETLPAPPASSTFSFMLPERGAVAHYDQFKPPMRPAYRGAKRRWTSAGVRHHVPWSTSIPRFSPYSRP